MANYYTLFSFAISGITADEHTWVQGLLNQIDDLEEAEEDQQEHDSATLVNLDAPRLADLLEDKDFLGFEASLEEDGDLWIHADETGHVENVVGFVQAFLRKFRPDEAIGFEWANTCSGPRLDAFGGGAAYITVDDVDFMSSSRWLSEQQRPTPRDERTLYRWTVADADQLAGREVTDDEIGRIEKAMDHSSAGESFEAVVFTVCDPISDH